MRQGNDGVGDKTANQILMNLHALRAKALHLHRSRPVVPSQHETFEYVDQMLDLVDLTEKLYRAEAKVQEPSTDKAT